MADYLSVTDLVTRAKNGEQQAWDALVERYAPLIWSICRRYRLEQPTPRMYAKASGSSWWPVWTTCAMPAALPGWLATTTRRECGRVVHAAGRRRAGEQVLIAATSRTPRPTPVDQELLVAEQHAALRDAFSRLPPGCQQLLTLLIADPPVPYAEISARLGISAGSIGPNRRRCLDRLGRDPAIAALIGTEAASTAG